MLSSCLYKGKIINLIGDLKSNNDNVFSVLVGVNGVGKSRLLSAIAINSAGINVLPASSKNERLKEVSNNLDPDYSFQFSKTIASSVSPFDKFPVIKRNNGVYKDYKYLGIRGISGENIGFTHMSRIVGDLFGEIFKDESRVKICAQVLKYLGYSESIDLDFKISPILVSCIRNFNAISSMKEFANLVEKYDGSVVAINMALDDGLFSDLEVSDKIKAQNLAFGSGDSSNTEAQNVSERLFAIFFLNLEALGIYEFSEFLDICKAFDFGSTVSVGIIKGRVYCTGDVKLTELISKKIGDFVINGLLVLKKFGVRKLNTKRIINLSSASSGEQSVLLSLLGISAYIKDRSLILIDEPEICLHPSWQERYIGLLMESFSDFSECHFILATHSPQIISSLPEGNSFVIDIGESSLNSSAEFLKKSADFQLATVFHSPGYRNEYLTKQIAIALSILTSGRSVSSDRLEVFNKLLLLEGKLKDDDPTKQLLIILGKALKVYDKERLDD